MDASIENNKEEIKTNEMKLQVVEEITDAPSIDSENISEKTQGKNNVFKSWLSSKKCVKADNKPRIKTRTSCPLCSEEKFDLKLHLMTKHGMDV